GRPFPPSMSARGLIDTGSDVSAVAPAILAQLGIPVYSRATSQGIGGRISVRLFSVSLFVLDVARPALPWLMQPDLLVIELPTLLQVDVLIGMDILLGCRMLLDGPVGQFTLEFP